MIDNYIYLYHTDTLVAIPTYADKLEDTMNIKFNSNEPLSRSAPIYSYSSSGPRSIHFTLNLHRDMMLQINYGLTELDTTLYDDYVDFIIKALQACAVPKYESTNKLVNPPVIAVRMGKDVFIKGIIQGSVSVSYELPILRNGKYANVTLSFTVNEIDPYGADELLIAGSYRGLSKTLERRIYTNI